MVKHTCIPTHKHTYKAAYRGNMELFRTPCNHCRGWPMHNLLFESKTSECSMCIVFHCLKLLWQSILLSRGYKIIIMQILLDAYVYIPQWRVEGSLRCSLNIWETSASNYNVLLYCSVELWSDGNHCVCV